MALDEKRIHELTEVGDKTDLYIALDAPGLPEAVKFNANNIIDKGYTDTLYVKVSGNETVNGVKTWANQQIMQAGIDITGGNVSIQSGGKLSVNKAIGTDIVEIYAPKGNLVLQLADTTDGYTQIAYKNSTHYKWTSGVLANTFATTSLQNAFFIYQQTDKAGSSVNAYRFIINNAGNVGIGTTSPGYKLHVEGNLYTNGTFYISGNITQTGTATQLDVDPYQKLRIGRTTSNVSFGVDIYKGDGTSSINHSFEGTGNSYVCLDNGFFGVNVSSVRNLFSVNSDTAYDPPALGSPTGVSLSILAGNLFGLVCGVDSSGNSWIQSQRVDGTATAYNIILQPTGGNVAIGTMIANNTLHVYKESLVSGSQVYLEGRKGGYGAGIEMISELGDNTTKKSMAKIVADGESAWNSTATTQNARLTFHASFEGTLTERMRINYLGNVGIGTTSPDSRLHVYENSTNTGSAAGITIQNAGTGDRLIYFTKADVVNESFMIGIDASYGDDTLRIAKGTNFDTIYFEFNGGVSSPRIRDNSTTSSASVYIDATTGLMQRVTSSEKVKNNINYRIDPELIFKLKPCEFDSKVDKNKNMLGFIAEQVNEIDQRFANGQDNKDGLMGLEINAILAAAVAGLQNVNERLKKLEKRKTK